MADLENVSLFVYESPAPEIQDGTQGVATSWFHFLDVAAANSIFIVPIMAETQTDYRSRKTETGLKTTDTKMTSSPTSAPSSFLESLKETRKSRNVKN